MRLALLGTRGYPSTYGGFETLIRHLAPYLRDSGHDVTVFGREGAPGTSVVDGITCVRTGGLESKSFSTLTYGLTSHVQARREKFDAAFVANVANGFYLPILRTARIPTVMNVDGIEWERAKWGRLARTVFRAGAHASARHATTLVADSRRIAERWQDEFGRTPTFIPYGAPDVDPDMPTEGLNALGILPGTYALVVARLSPENNVDAVLEAFESRPDYPLVVVGTANYDSPTQRRLDDILRRRAGVIALGHVADQDLLLALWRNAKVYIHGHSVGGTNPALLQAMGCAAPVLAFDSIYNREVASTTAVYWDSPAALAGALDEAWQDAEGLASMGVAGLDRVRRDYQWPTVCRQYERVLASAATSGTSRAKDPFP